MEKGRLNREIWGVVICLTALLITISFFTYHPSDRSFNTPSGAIDTNNWGGFVGAYLADFLLQGFGVAAYLLPIFLCLIALQMFRPKYTGISYAKASGYVILLISTAVILCLFIESENAREAGGIVGGFLKETVLIPLFGRISAVLISLFALLLSLLLLTQYSLLDILNSSKKQLSELEKSLVPAVISRFRELKEKKEKLKGENTKKERRDYVPPPIVLKEEHKEDAAKKVPKKPAIPPEQFKLLEIGEGYKLPPAELLDFPEGGNQKLDTETLHANSLILQKKLADFGVEGEVVAVRPGPVITMYEFKPAAGVKVRRIVTLADDLAMALRAVSVRILAPIPGESVVGIEIPNPRRETVFLREVIESEAYRDADSKLTLALGKDISGSSFTTDLARMPHLLVPVVTDPKKAAAALFWAMDEMDHRYRLMRDKGARNIDNYNRVLEKETAIKKGVIELMETDPNDAKSQLGGDLGKEPPLVHERLPRIVIIIDELADLMMSVGRDIEEYITRLAQKARAAGIHLILATQR